MMIVALQKFLCLFDRSFVYSINYSWMEYCLNLLRLRIMSRTLVS